MRKVSRMGTTALALALSATMLAPISANAEVMENYDAATKTYTYVNEDTNEVVTYQKDEGEMRNVGVLSKETRVYYMSAGDIFEMPYLYTTPDVVKFTDFKSSNKGLKVRVYDKYEYTNCGEPHYAYYKKENGVKKYYYKDVNGNWQSKDEDELKALYKGSGRYQLQFHAKKAGKYKITYNARNAEGAVVANKSFYVIAKEDARPIKSITYGGKNVLTDTDGDGREDYKNYYAKHGDYTSKRKGKLVVKTNKGFKIKKLEVSPYVVSTKTYDEDGWSGTENSSNIEMDLNGNGSTKDHVNNQNERSVNRVWKTIKNNKVLKLYTTNDEESDNKNIVNKKDNSKTIVRQSKGVIHPTYLRITLYDTKNHRTIRQTVLLRLYKK